MDSKQRHFIFLIRYWWSTRIVFFLPLIQIAWSKHGDWNVSFLLTYKCEESLYCTRMLFVFTMFTRCSYGSRPLLGQLPLWKSKLPNSFYIYRLDLGFYQDGVSWERLFFLVLSEGNADIYGRFVSFLSPFDLRFELRDVLAMNNHHTSIDLLQQAARLAYAPCSLQ